MKVIPVFEKHKDKFKPAIVHEVMVDDEDYPDLIKYAWIWRDGYACRKTGRSYYGMHRQIMGVLPKEKILVDHENGDHANNQRYNLRKADRFQNQQNRKTNEGNTLPKGIRMLPNGKYNVRIQGWLSREVFGAYNTIEEAVEARNARAAELHKEFMRPSYIIENGDTTK